MVRRLQFLGLHRLIIMLLLVVCFSHANTYRILIAVSDSAAKQMGTTLKQDVIRKGITIPNEIYRNTPTPDTVQLAGIVRVNYKESGDVCTDVDRLRTIGEAGNYLDTVHTLRNNYAADVVQLYVNYPLQAGCGYVNANANTAFSVVDYYRTELQLSQEHEIGHNFGGDHDTAHDPDLDNPFTYNHGFWANYNGSDWGTIMSYFGVGDRRRFYSNPDSTFRGVLRGTVLRCDNARLHRERSAVIAGFRTPMADVAISNRTFSSSEFGDVTATNSITVGGNDTLKDSSELWLRANSSVTINSNFSVARLANLTIKTGSTALLGKQRNSSYSNNPIAPSTPGTKGLDLQNISLKALLAGNRLIVNYGLPVETNTLILRLYDLQGKLLLSRFLGNKTSGNHVENVAIQDNIKSNFYLIQLKTDKAIKSLKFISK